MKKTIIPPVRIATEADFRTSKNTFILNMEYYEQPLYCKTMHLEVTDQETDINWLKVKIAQGLIHVPLVPVFWNQKPLTDIKVVFKSA